MLLWQHSATQDLSLTKLESTSSLFVLKCVEDILLSQSGSDESTVTTLTFPPARERKSSEFTTTPTNG
eukprot:4629660-Pleurochrysis_carterae.AAC.1